MSNYEIGEEYKSLYSDDNCSLRDINYLLDEYSHIFLNLYHNIYTVICESADLSKNNQVDNFGNYVANIFYSKNRIDSLERENSLKSIVIRHVASKGPRFAKEVYDFLSNSNQIAGNAGFVLRNPEFVLLVPGYYDLYENIESTIKKESVRQRLLNVENCRNYVLARFAGESINAFPLWNYQMEYEWCAWASINAPVDVYESLLFVANPNNWKMNQDTLESWIDSKRRFANFHLERKLNMSIANYVPTVENIFRSLYVLKLNDGAGYTLINRVAKPLLFDDWKSASILAILIKMGCIEPASHWMHYHKVGNCKDSLDKWISEFIKYYIHKKQKKWNSPLGEKIINHCINNNAESWIKNDDFALLISTLKRTKN